MKTVIALARVFLVSVLLILNFYVLVGKFAYVCMWWGG